MNVCAGKDCFGEIETRVTKEDRWGLGDLGALSW